MASRSRRPSPRINRSRWGAILDLITVLKPVRFSVLMVLIGFLGLFVAEQGRDTLRALAEWDGNHRGMDAIRLATFYLALTFWAGSAWYAARVMLTLHFPVPSDADPKRIRFWCAHLPRLLGALAFFSAAAACIRLGWEYQGFLGTAGRLYSMAATSLVLGIVFIIILRKRRVVLGAVDQQLKRRFGKARFARSLPGRWLLSAFEAESRPEDTCNSRHWHELGSGPWTAIVLTSLLSLVLFVLFIVEPVATGAFLGAGSVLLLAAGGWIVLGSLLVFFAERWRVPLITIALLLAGVFSLWNDNHPVPALPGSSTARPEIGKAVEEWLAVMDERYPNRPRHRFILVAAEGGGIRAAYWTAQVLAQLQETDQDFAEHLFAVSGVSGGSLGGSVFAALVAECGHDRAPVCDDAPLTATPGWRGAAHDVLSQDFLAPALGAMLYPDLMQRFFPYPFAAADRSHALEASWAQAWRAARGNDRLRQPLLAARASRDGHVPHLLLNSTSVESGRRVVAGTLRLNRDATDATDLIDLTGTDLPFVSAIHNSARFTYVSPAGYVIEQESKQRQRLVDGGYFENAGATTLLDLLDAIPAHLRKRLDPVAIVITNDPRVGQPDKPVDLLAETRAPFAALLKAREARAEYAKNALRGAVGSDHYVVFGTCQRAVPLPLGWQLSVQAMAELRAQAGSAKCANVDNAAAVRRVRGMLR